jgi:multidrug transporter EmrE-like cation transporter
MKKLFVISRVISNIMDQVGILILGVVLALLSSIIFNIAPILQKQGLNEMGDVNMENVWQSIKAMFKNTRWVVGFILGMVGSIPYIISLNLAGVTVVQPLINFGLIVLVYFSHKTFNEEITLKAKLAITGMIIVPFFITFANVSAPQADITTSQVIWTFFIAVGILSVVVGVCIGIAKKKPIFWAFASGIMFAAGATAVQALVSTITFLGYDIVKDFGFLFIHMFTDITFIWIVIFAILAILLNALATYLLQIALQKTDVSKAGPINQTMNNIFTVLVGLIVFQQLVGNVFLYAIGFIIAVISAFILAQYQVQ